MRCRVCSHRQSCCFWMLLGRGVEAVWDLLMGRRVLAWPVDIHHDTHADTRRRVALTMHDMHIFLLFSVWIWTTFWLLPSCDVECTQWIHVQLCYTCANVLHLFIHLSLHHDCSESKGCHKWQWWNITKYIYSTICMLACAVPSLFAGLSVAVLFSSRILLCLSVPLSSCVPCVPGLVL